MTTASEKVVYRASMSGIDPDGAYRALRLAKAVKSWADPTRTLYQLGACTIEVFEQADSAVLLASGPTEDDARNAVARLGYGPDGVTVTPIHPERPRGRR